jgi:elongation factor G
MFVPDPVIKVAVNPLKRSDADKMAKALQRFRREDPTFHVTSDAETNEILIAGMGELHLEIYIERIRREYGVALEVGPPKVSYREAPTISAEFDYKHKKQTGGAGQYAHIVGRLEPQPADAEESFLFEESITGGRIPKQYIPSVEKGFRDMLAHGPVAKFPVVHLKVVLEDGSYHDVDSSDRAFQTAARDCFRAIFPRTKPVLLEPIMNVEVEAPEAFQGSIVGDLTSRRAIITSTDIRDGVATIKGELPLAETFGYATDLRSMTQGRGVFVLEPAFYRKTPAGIQEQIIADKRQDELVGTR